MSRRAEDEAKDEALSKVKGYGMAVWALVGTLVSGTAGIIWTASELFGQLNGNTEAIEAMAGHEERLVKIEKSLTDNDVSRLQGKLAELGTSLASIMERQRELMAIQDKVTAAEKAVAENEVIVKGIDSRFKKQDREIQDLWDGLDAVSNPLR